MIPEAVQQRIEYEPNSGCWLWVGARSAGYGKYQTHRAHRLLYEAVRGPVPTDTLDHLCRNRICVNPFHLEAVSRGENARRGLLRPTCQRGHGRSVTSTGRRYCKECTRLHVANLYATRGRAGSKKRSLMMQGVG